MQTLILSAINHSYLELFAPTERYHQSAIIPMEIPMNSSGFSYDFSHLQGGAPGYVGL